MQAAVSLQQKGFLDCNGGVGLRTHAYYHSKQKKCTARLFAVEDDIAKPLIRTERISMRRFDRGRLMLLQKRRKGTCAVTIHPNVSHLENALNDDGLLIDIGLFRERTTSIAVDRFRQYLLCLYLDASAQKFGLIARCSHRMSYRVVT